MFRFIKNKCQKKAHNKKSVAKNQSSSVKIDNFFEYLVELINKVIDYRFFYLFSIVLISSFFVYKILAYTAKYWQSNDYLAEYPISINIKDSNLQIAEDLDEEYQIKTGDTLNGILLESGVPAENIQEIVNKVSQHLNLLTLSNQDTIIISQKNITDPLTNTTKKTFRQITIDNNFDLEVAVKNIAGEFQVTAKHRKISKKTEKFHFKIKDSLFVDGVNAGITASSMMSLINLYAYDIDFQRDFHLGDEVEILVEGLFDENGKKVKENNVLYSLLKLQEKTIETYAFNIDGKIEYFDAKGNSIKKSLLKTPINGARISSTFGMRRHPVLGYSKMHKGTDFAAPTGTPILSAGSGVVVFAGRKGGYGNYVEIKHNREYSTAYAHASRFAKNIASGQKVKQGEVVAFVGTTGRSTGPHLHFEVLYRGSQINPAVAKSVSGIVLLGKSLLKFKENKNNIDNNLRNLTNSSLN